MQELEQFYENYDEDTRLTTRQGQVEYLTTMKYIHEGLQPGQRVLEIGAGTGRYALALAREGYRVDAVELVQKNLDALLAKIQPGEKVAAAQGNALNLSMYADDTFDLTLCLGPMYHLYTELDKVQALREAVRVTKRGGRILVAYCMNEATIISYCFIRNAIHDCLAKGMLTEDYRCLSEPKDIFEMVRTEDIARLNAQVNAEQLKLVATDGAANYLRDTLAAMDDATFDLFMDYHLKTCERADLIGATHHSLSILRKKD